MSEILDDLWLVLMVLVPVATFNLAAFLVLEKFRVHPWTLKKLWRLQLSVVAGVLAVCALGLGFRPAAVACFAPLRAEGSTLLLTRLCAGLWLVIAAALAGLDAWRWRRAVVGSRAWAPLDDARVEEIRRAIGPARVRLFASAEGGSPFVFGALRPRLVLTPNIINLQDQRAFRGIVAHELVHLRDRDGLWGVLHQAFARLLFFHPLAAWHSRVLHAVVEKAADAEAIAGASIAPADFARGLLLAVETATVPALNFSPSYRELRGRLESLGRPARRGDAWRTGTFLLLTTAAVCGWSVSEAQNKLGLTTEDAIRCTQIRHEQLLQNLLRPQTIETQCAPLEAR